MLEFLIASLVTCTDAADVIDRVLFDERLTNDVKAELVYVLKEHSNCDRNANVD